MKSICFTAADLELAPYETDPARVTPGVEISIARMWTRDDGSEVGSVWEMTPGTLTGVKGNESFVLLEGHARIDYPDGRSFDVRPGDAVFIAPGDTCDFTAIEKVRKVVVFRLDA